MTPEALEAALDPLAVNTNPDARYALGQRRWQGVAGIERAPSGRLWATWYSGGAGEGKDNFVLAVTSADGGETWSDPRLVVDDPEGDARAFDPVLWLDPTGRLWLFWAQSRGWFDGRAGVWAIVTEAPDEPDPAWSAPRRLADGIMMNKPVVLSSGAWLLPAAVWDIEPRRADIAALRHPNVYVSSDAGATWPLRGHAPVDTGGQPDEHMVVERRDGTLWMLYRTGVASIGLGEAFSRDAGRTWVPEGGRDAGIPHPATRFFVRRLASGRLLLLHHHGFWGHEAPPYPAQEGRTHLTASLSEDDGATWPHRLLIDERYQVAYPDATAYPDGTIDAIYDRNRKTEGEILMARFTEQEILDPEMSALGPTRRRLVSRLPAA